MTTAQPKLTEAYISRNHILVEIQDQYGDQRTIYKQKGHALRVKKATDTYCLKMNRIAAVLIGHKITEKRLAANLTYEQLGAKAGLAGSYTKQRVYKIEKGIRKEGMRFGTLYAIAIALNCQPSEIMPTNAEILEILNNEEEMT
jgi:DNA-binding Xre family transcriptional regulator